MENLNCSSGELFLEYNRRYVRCNHSYRFLHNAVNDMEQLDSYDINYNVDWFHGQRHLEGKYELFLEDNRKLTLSWQNSVAKSLDEAT